MGELRRTRVLVTPQELTHRLPSVAPFGLEPLDRLLGGGLPEGRVVELGAAKGGSASALGLWILARFTREGRVAAIVDRADAFDPRGAAEAGAELERTLWCRPSSDREAIRAADVLLASGAFPLVILDLGKGPVGKREPPISQGAWLRLARDAEAARASLLVLGGAVAAGVSAASLRISGSRARFWGRGPGRTFEGLDLTVALERNRLGLPPGEVTLSFRSPSHFTGSFPAGMREPEPGQARSGAWEAAGPGAGWGAAEGAGGSAWQPARAAPAQTSAARRRAP